MSHMFGAFMHEFPISSKKAGKNPTFASMSNVSEQAVRHAIHNTSHEDHISPASMKSTGSQKTQHIKVLTHASYQGGTNVYAPQPQLPQAQIKEYNYGSPTTEYKSRKDLLVVHMDPPQSTATPPCYVEIAVEDILSRVDIHSRTKKRSIMDALTEDFYTTNELTRRKIQPHENMKMYLHSLELFLKEQVPSLATLVGPASGMARQGQTEEVYAYKVMTHEDMGIAPIQRVLFKQEMMPAGSSRTLVNDPNIEGAIGQMSAPHQAGESLRDYNHHMQAMQRLAQTDYLDLPQVEMQSSSIKTQSMHAGLSNLAFVQHEVRGHSTQVRIVAPPAERYIPCSELWTDRVVYQRMRMGDLQNGGVSHIEDQAVIFYNGQVIDLLQTRTLDPQGQTAAAPNPDDGDGDDKDEDDDGTNR